MPSNNAIAATHSTALARSWPVPSANGTPYQRANRHSAAMRATLANTAIGIASNTRVPRRRQLGSPIKNATQ
jgi:hypothetical protein